MKRVTLKILILAIMALTMCLPFACNRKKDAVTVTFVTDGGTQINTLVVNDKKADKVLPADPERAGYVFDGWYSDQQRTLPYTLDERIFDVTESVTLYAKWTPDVNSYSNYSVRLVFEPNGGAAISSYVIHSGDPYSDPPTAVREPFLFGGWYMDNNIWQKPYGRAYLTTVDSDVTVYLYARWLAATCDHEFDEGTFACQDRKCLICGEIVSATLSHDLLTEVVDGNCMKVGYIRKSCRRCGMVHENLSTVEYAHTPGAAATCTEAQKCTLCGKVVVEALGHKATSAADCTHASVCSVCGVQISPALGHLPGSTATCTVGQYCSRCQTELSPPLGHDFSSDYTVDKEPTCTVSGWESRHCTRCNQATTGSREIAPKGHVPQNEPTCTDPSVCSVCGATVTPELGHQFVAKVIEPTATEMGYTLYTCLRCGIAYSSNAQSALGYPLSYYAGADDASGTLPTSEYVLAGSTVYLPLAGTLTRNGYVFAGWSNGTKVYPGGYKYTMPKYGILFTAVWLDASYSTWDFIYTEQELRAVSRRLGGHYVLLNDLNLGGLEWEPLGGEESFFSGLFDGNGHVVSNFKITYTGRNYYGLFARVSGQIQNLTVSNFQIQGNENYGYCGGIAAYVDGGLIRNCHVTSTVINGYSIAGGIVGNAVNASITACSANATVSTSCTQYTACTGGIVANTRGTTITDCYFTGTLRATGSGPVVGGLVARLRSSEIRRSFVATTSILSYSSDRIAYGGGLAGYVDASSGIYDSFSLASIDISFVNDFQAIVKCGRLAAESEGVISNCYGSASQVATFANRPYEFTNDLGTLADDDDLRSKAFLTGTLNFAEYVSPISFSSFSSAVWKFTDGELPTLYGVK